MPRRKFPQVPPVLHVDPTLVYLGDCVQLRRCAGAGSKSHTWNFREGRAGLFATADSKKIFILPMRGVQKSFIDPGGPLKKHEKLFAKWSRFQADRVFEFTISDRLSRLAQRGFACVIQYVSDKWTGRKCLYQHDFEKPTPLYFAGKTHPHVFGLVSATGSDLVSSAGLIG